MQPSLERYRVASEAELGAINVFQWLQERSDYFIPGSLWVLVGCVTKRIQFIDCILYFDVDLEREQVTYVAFRVSYPQNRIGNVIRDENDDYVVPEPNAMIVEFQRADLSKLLTRNYIPVELLQPEEPEELEDCDV